MKPDDWMPEPDPFDEFDELTPVEEADLRRMLASEDDR